MYAFWSDNKFYGAVAGDQKNLVINIQTKERNTNLDILKEKNKNSFSKQWLIIATNFKTNHIENVC